MDKNIILKLKAVENNVNSRCKTGDILKDIFNCVTDKEISNNIFHRCSFFKSIKPALGGF